MSDGIKNIQYAVLQQVVDPLEFCIPQIPVPTKIGIPCMPCELPNEYGLFSANQSYQLAGMKIWDIIEDSNCFQRTICCPSNRSMKITSKDFYSYIPVAAAKNCSIPLTKNIRPELRVNYQDKYVGKILEPYQNSCCNKIFHRVHIYNDRNEVIYTLEAKMKANCCLVLPKVSCCDQITYQIYDKYNNQDGEIRHLFFGYYNEACTKADKYGISFPAEASEQQKALIVMACVLIDYLQFENF